MHGMFVGEFTRLDAADLALGLSTTKPPEPKPAKREGAAKPAYREGKKCVATWINEGAARQLKAMAAEEGTSVQDLVVEMLNREFARRGKPPLA